MTETTAKRDRTWFAILAGIVLLGVILRAWAALRLPLDYDEPVYLQAGFDYARALGRSDIGGVIDYAENREHPALGKLLYALVVVVVGQDAGWQLTLYAGRILSALMGTLAVLLLALLDPLAGGLLAAHTMVVKYTSQVYLEALPHLASLASVLALNRSSKRRDRWFWLSALALGVTAAGKFTYVPIVVVILYLAIWEKRTRWTDLALYFAVTVAAFWLLNPTLWRDPLTRLADNLFFHLRYSQGPRVQLVGHPWYQPLHWISRSPPSIWHPDAFFYFALDGVIFLLALPGLFWEWKERRWVVVWLAAGLLFLLAWPTKWPQYTLILTPALCLAASSAAKHIYHLLRQQEIYWDWIRNLIPIPPLSFWIIAGALLVILVVGYTAATVQLTMGRLGWLNLRTQSTQLPSNTVYDIAAGWVGDPDADPRADPHAGMVLGTERGAAIWSPPATTDLPATWMVFTSENSPLPSDRVLAVLLDRAGAAWFGTEAGLARYDGRDWEVYQAEDLGLADDKVYALVEGSDGRLWVGTNAGAAVYDGQGWTPFTAATSGLADDWVRALAIEALPGGDLVWFGTAAGLSRLEPASGEWLAFDEFDSVTDLFVDSNGRVWAGTMGDGLALWDGESWQFYRTSNSDIPFSSVSVIAETEPGVIWVGTARPAEVGGGLAEFDTAKGTWHLHTRRNSGYSGAEPLAIAQDSEGRWWIGTRTSGIDIYQVNR
ncbi:MAG: two-component regulator propeller domain-containing protein [Anaerolineae bacterium]